MRSDQKLICYAPKDDISQSTANHEPRMSFADISLTDDEKAPNGIKHDENQPQTSACMKKKKRLKRRMRKQELA